MSPERKKIYAFVESNPNVTVNQVVDAVKLSRSLCYKFLSTDHFIGTRVRNEMGMVIKFKINDHQVVANTQIPRHHYIHQAFWGLR